MFSVVYAVLGDWSLYIFSAEISMNNYCEWVFYYIEWQLIRRVHHLCSWYTGPEKNVLDCKRQGNCSVEKECKE